MKIIYAQEDLSKIDGNSIFLAGPTPREEYVDSWRPQAIELFKEKGFKGTILLPEMRDGWNSDFEYADQIDWESRALYLSNVIMFWIPRDIDEMRMPAFTTNFELGEWLAKDPKKLTLGWPIWADKMNYIEHRAKEAFIPIHKTLKDTVEKAIYKSKYYS